jgi:hypothetical protein
MINAANLFDINLISETAQLKRSGATARLSPLALWADYVSAGGIDVSGNLGSVNRCEAVLEMSHVCEWEELRGNRLLARFGGVEVAHGGSDV